MTSFAKKLAVTMSILVLLGVTIAQVVSGVVPGTAILRSFELSFMFWLIVTVVGCLLNQ